MKWIGTGAEPMLALALLLAAASGPAADDVSVNSCWCGWYFQKWVERPHDSTEPLEQAKLDAVSDRYIAACEAEAKAKPSAAAQQKLGDALLFRGRWSKARAAYQQALKGVDPRSYEAVMLQYHLAETEFAEGHPAAAKDRLRKAVDLGVDTVRRKQPDWSALAYDALEFLSEKDLDRNGLPCRGDCRPFPEPQVAKYSETFAKCSRIAISLEGVDAGDARVRLLTRKLRSRGFSATLKKGAEDYRLSIRLDPKTPLEKPEGYLLEVAQGGAKIRARDRQGILWGIVSFLQVTDPKRLSARVCRVADWPDCPRRGYVGHFWSGCTEFTVFNKMNCVVHQRHPLIGGADTPLNVYQCETLAKEFRELGLELDYSILSWTMDMGLPYCWRNYLGMQIDIGRRFAAMGAGVYYPNDDCRYNPDVLRQEDLADGRRPSDFDAQHILDFFNGVKAKHPDFRMIYCPPFYWGPTKGHPYPDDRDKYLASLRILPPEVSLFWTGDRVKSYQKTPDAVKWFTDLTGHKPLVFQNATGPHNLLSYVIDRTDWNAWHYPGFFENDVAGYLKNSATPSECPQITTLADCLWHVKGYDPERSIRRGIGNWAGNEFFRALDAVKDDLWIADVFKYGEVTSGIRDFEVEDLQTRYDRIMSATAKVRKLKGDRFVDRECGVWTRMTGWYAKILDAAKKQPDYRVQYAAYLQRVHDAAVASGYDEKAGDVYLDTVAFRHSPIMFFPEQQKRQPPPPNQITACVLWDSCYIDTKFTVKKPKSSVKEGTLWVYGENTRRVNGPNPTWQFKVTLNDTVLYDGKVPFPEAFTPVPFKVPLSALHFGKPNYLKLQNGAQNRDVRISFAYLKL